MTREESIKTIQDFLGWFKEDSDIHKALEMAIEALSQEQCELLIIKSDILLHQDDRKKWVERIKREKESGVIILPPYFEPLLVPNDIEISIEQEPCKDLEREYEKTKALFSKIVKDDDAISRMLAQEEITKSIELKENPHQLWERIQALPSVTPTCEEREKGECPWYA